MENAEGVNVNVPRKSEVAALLKQTFDEPTNPLPTAHFGSLVLFEQNNLPTRRNT